MRLFAGLGNPGAKYAGNRHNIGFMAVDAIARQHGFAPWRSRFKGSATEGVIAGEKVVLLKPETFMNLSGQSVGEALRFWKLEPGALTVLHDELDLAPGKIKAKAGGGHAGHNGLRSIHEHIGEAYGRIRMGIGHPGNKDRVAGYVLQDFAKTDAAWLDPLLDAMADAAPSLAQGDPAAFLNRVALQLAPPKPQPNSARTFPAAQPPAIPPGTAPTPPDGDAAAAGPRSVLQRLADRFRDG